MTTLLAAVLPGGASATPGVPDQPMVLFGENFENNPQPTVTPITSYQGAPPLNETYRTDPQWAPDATSCNGLITAFVDPRYCVSATADGNMRLMARMLGSFAGDATPDDNHVVSAYTDLGRDPGANNIELETVKPIALPGSGNRFLVFSADVAAATCGPLRPSPYTALFAFSQLTGGSEIPLAAAPTDVRAGSRCPAGKTFRGRVVARAIRVQPNGHWTAKITLPQSLRGTRVFLRGQTRVPRTTRNPKRFGTFTLIQGVGLR